MWRAKARRAPNSPSRTQGLVLNQIGGVFFQVHECCYFQIPFTELVAYRSVHRSGVVDDLLRMHSEGGLRCFNISPESIVYILSCSRISMACCVQPQGRTGHTACICAKRRCGCACVCNWQHDSFCYCRTRPAVPCDCKLTHPGWCS